MRPNKVHHPDRTHKRKYEVQAPIGHGGFGTVYRARLTGPGGFEKMVAIKILNQDAAAHPELARRLRDEARMLGLVRHQAIVQVDGLLQVQGRWGIVMEYVDGIDLLEVVRRVQIPPRAALEMIGNVASALEIAWNTCTNTGDPLHLIHRDIKPSNIKITLAGEVKMLDFGIARAEFEAREAQTRHGTFGTQQYMAPERLDGRDGPPSDVYALGVVLFECLTRRQLYEKSCFKRRELHQDRVVMAQELAWRETNMISEPLIRFVGELLHFDPDERPGADEVSRRCDELVDAMPGPRLRAWARTALPELIHALSGPEEDGLTGAVLIEQTGEHNLDGHEPARIPTPVHVVPSSIRRPATRSAAPLTEDIARALPPARKHPAKPTVAGRTDRRLNVPLWLLALVLFVTTGLASLGTSLIIKGVLGWATARAASTAGPSRADLPPPEAASAILPPPPETTATPPAATPPVDEPIVPPPEDVHPPGPSGGNAVPAPVKAGAVGSGATKGPKPPSSGPPTPKEEPPTVLPASTPPPVLPPAPEPTCQIRLSDDTNHSAVVRVGHTEYPLPHVLIPGASHLVTIYSGSSNRPILLPIDTSSCTSTITITCAVRRCAAKADSPT